MSAPLTWEPVRLTHLDADSGFEVNVTRIGVKWSWQVLGGWPVLNDVYTASSGYEDTRDDAMIAGEAAFYSAVASGRSAKVPS